METESTTLLNQLRLKHKNQVNTLRALLVALLGISMSACAFASQPVELELDDDQVTQQLNNVSFARRSNSLKKQAKSYIMYCAAPGCKSHSPRRQNNDMNKVTIGK
ncbi:Uncharacterized protein OBRU01_10250 [Operophtera brumata]|uniref:Uncharacterized protein n=1 Tax=Operophtera brumata TaxID=104452 RepID=A0A0L7L3E1_OPEBR|nr:Uncharacterized protein OBRU01_10250 [Operophtera brumata]